MKVRTLCAHCGAVKSEKFYPDSVGRSKDVISHGICESCAKDVDTGIRCSYCAHASNYLPNIAVDCMSLQMEEWLINNGGSYLATYGWGLKRGATLFLDALAILENCPYFKSLTDTEKLERNQRWAENPRK